MSRIGLGASCLVLFLAIFAWVGSLSPCYQKCEAESAHKQSYSGQEDSPQERAGRIGDRIAIVLRCEGVFFDENSPAILRAITALATVAIAAFTLTLKQSTDRLWKLASAN